MQIIEKKLAWQIKVPIPEVEDLEVLWGVGEYHQLEVLWGAGEDHPLEVLWDHQLDEVLCEDHLDLVDIQSGAIKEKNVNQLSPNVTRYRYLK